MILYIYIYIYIYRERERERERERDERTNKAKIRSEEQSEKAESYREYLWNEIQLQLKGPYRQKKTQEQNTGTENGETAWLMSLHAWRVLSVTELSSALTRLRLMSGLSWRKGDWPRLKVSASRCCGQFRCL